jgi:SAM-dependent methyltransferase
MALLTFDSLGLFRDEKQILAIGPGNEAMVHWLTNRMGRVVATHLRLEAGAWIESPFGGEILVDAERQWPWRWRPGRLVVEPMDARDLRVEDRTVDAVVCSNLIEHYSEPADARRVIEEIFRVLRFGGVAALALPFRLQGPAPGPPGVRLFDESELRTLMLDELTWAMTTALNTDLSRDTLRSETTVDDTSENAPAGPSQSVQKQVLLRQGEHLWTSAHVALVKPVPIR